MDLKETPEVMGKFGAVFGIKGWLKVFSFTENPENLFTYKPWFIDTKAEVTSTYRRFQTSF